MGIIMQPYNFARILFETVLVFGKGQNDEIHDNLPTSRISEK
jgi:hypothetical protein